MGVVRRTRALCAVGCLSIAGCGTLTDTPITPAIARAQLPARTSLAPPATFTPPAPRSPLESSPPLDVAETPLPINLATALQLANARPFDVQIAGKQVEAAVARYDRARLLWVPNLSVGTDYLLHSGPQQAFNGDLVKSNRSSFMVGFGPNVVFAFSDAVYAPLAARQDLRARQADQQTARNDATLDVAQAYFGVQQARGELAAALATVVHAGELARKTTTLAKGLAPPAEANRANAELGRRKQLAASARERWRTSSAELARLLRLDPNAIVEPVEPPFIPVTLIDATMNVDALIPIALASRPELAGNQAIVQATLARLKQEKLRPLVPSLAVRSVSTNPSGSLGYGVFGGGRNGDLQNFAGRVDIDMQLVWEFQALGFGNKARVNERRAEHELATLELFRTQDRIAAEVVSAFAAVRASAERVNEAEPALREAIELVNKTVEGLGQTRRTGDVLSLVVRPQEAVAAVQTFAQAGTDFFAAIADYNRAQFRLYRALGHSAECLAAAVPTPVYSPPTPPAVPVPAPVPALPPIAIPEPNAAQLPVIPLVPSVVPRVEEAVPPVASVVPSVQPVEPPPAPVVPDEWKPAVDKQPAAPMRPPVVIPEREPKGN